MEFLSDGVHSKYRGLSQFQNAAGGRIDFSPKLNDDVNAPFEDHYYPGKIVAIGLTEPVLTKAQLQGTSQQREAKKAKVCISCPYLFQNA